MQNPSTIIQNYPNTPTDHTYEVCSKSIQIDHST